MESEWQPDAAALAAFLREFEGTPHVQRRRQAGRGVDCIQLVLGALEAAGATPPISLPSYSQQIGFSQGINTMTGAFLECFHTTAIPIAGWKPRDGDVGLFRTGRYSNHCGIVSGGRFWHVTTGTPTHHCAIATIEPKLQTAIRFFKPGIRNQDPATLTLQ